MVQLIILNRENFGAAEIYFFDRRPLPTFNSSRRRFKIGFGADRNFLAQLYALVITIDLGIPIIFLVFLHTSSRFFNLSLIFQSWSFIYYIQRFLMILRSGLWDGHFNLLMLLFFYHSFTILNMWLGAFLAAILGAFSSFDAFKLWETL